MYFTVHGRVYAPPEPLKRLPIWTPHHNSPHAPLSLTLVFWIRGKRARGRGKVQWCINPRTAPKSKILARCININVGGCGGKALSQAAKIHELSTWFFGHIFFFHRMCFSFSCDLIASFSYVLPCYFGFYFAMPFWYLFSMRIYLYLFFWLLFLGKLRKI